MHSMHSRAFPRILLPMCSFCTARARAIPFAPARACSAPNRPDRQCAPCHATQCACAPTDLSAQLRSSPQSTYLLYNSFAPTRAVCGFSSAHVDRARTLDVQPRLLSKPAALMVAPPPKTQSLPLSSTRRPSSGVDHLLTCTTPTLHSLSTHVGRPHGALALSPKGGISPDRHDVLGSRQNALTHTTSRIVLRRPQQPALAPQRCSISSSGPTHRLVTGADEHSLHQLVPPRARSHRSRLRNQCNGALSARPFFGYSFRRDAGL